jgi:hypothetical protein
MSFSFRVVSDQYLIGSCVASVRRKLPDMTLAEALVEYYAANAGRVLRPSDLSDESAELFRSHDICHVIFGLDTTFADEAMVDTRTLLSCDVGVRKYARWGI